MKRTIILMFVVTLMIPLMASAMGIKKGDRAIISDRYWVEIVNPKPIMSYTFTTLGYNEGCYVEFSNTVTVVGIDKDRVLVRYNDSAKPRSLSCPSGALFFITKMKFSKMMTKYYQTLRTIQEAKDYTEREKDLVERLLKNEK